MTDQALELKATDFVLANDIDEVKSLQQSNTMLSIVLSATMGIIAAFAFTVPIALLMAFTFGFPVPFSFMTDDIRVAIAGLVLFIVFGGFLVLIVVGCVSVAVGIFWSRAIKRDSLMIPLTLLTCAVLDTITLLGLCLTLK
ncbi:MAG: hypothetical protein CMJ78_04580 [Planctomycetaceae bacterium]|nr:hypothetical protein [Planctomycetaceae bacterium]